VTIFVVSLLLYTHFGPLLSLYHLFLPQKLLIANLDIKTEAKD